MAAGGHGEAAALRGYGWGTAVITPAGEVANWRRVGARAHGTKWYRPGARKRHLRGVRWWVLGHQAAQGASAGAVGLASGPSHLMIGRHLGNPGRIHLRWVAEDVRKWPGFQGCWERM